MTVLTIIAVSAMNIFCFFIGAKIGQSTSRGEKIDLPKIDVAKAMREHGERKEARQEQERVETILRNIDNYDGTERGQEDVPRG